MVNVSWYTIIGAAVGGDGVDDIGVWRHSFKHPATGHVDQQRTPGCGKLLRRSPHPDDAAATLAQRQAERGSDVAAAGGNQDPRAHHCFRSRRIEAAEVQKRTSYDWAMRARTAP